jgi:copper resistance protein D
MYGAAFMWIHLTASIAFIGATIFYFAAYRPALLRARWTDKPSQGQIDFSMLVEQRFRLIRWISLITLFLTGFFNLLYEGGSPRMETGYGGVLMLKLLLVFILMGMTGVHDFVVGPLGRNRQIAARREALTAVDPGSPWLGLAILALSLVLILVAVNLRSY